MMVGMTRDSLVGAGVALSVVMSGAALAVSLNDHWNHSSSSSIATSVGQQLALGTKLVVADGSQATVTVEELRSGSDAGARVKLCNVSSDPQKFTAIRWLVVVEGQEHPVQGSIFGKEVAAGQCSEGWIQATTAGTVSAVAYNDSSKGRVVWS